MTLAALSPISGIAPFGGGWLASTGDYLIGSAVAPALLGDGGATNNTAGRPVVSQALAGAGVEAFGADFYDRLHISETALDLGNVVGLQSRTISIWNAYRRTRTLSAVTVSGTGDVGLSGGPGTLPHPLGALAETAYTITVPSSGSPTIDTTITWDADPYDLVLRVTGMRVTAWAFVPDWSSPIVERIEWRTDVLQSYDGSEQRSALRLAPRQSWEFSCFFDGAARRYAEALIWGNGARTWALPIWPDGLQLLADLPSGSTEILIDTAGRAFTAGGLALLMTDERTAETLEVQAVQSDRLVLRRPTSRAWPAGARLLPARVAQLADSLKLGRWSGQASMSTLQFNVVGPVDHAADAGSATHRGLPVLERRPNWVEAPDVELARKLSEIDNMIGIPVRIDEAAMPLPAQRMRWLHSTRADLTAFRSLAYALRGRQGGIWVPTWCDDLQPVAIIGSSDLAMDVEWSGYTLHLYGQPGRMDLRIELADGTVFYRRVTGASEISASTERVLIDSALGRDVAPAEVLQVSFMLQARLDSDALEIAHWTGDTSESSTTFRGYRYALT